MSVPGGERRFEIAPFRGAYGCQPRNVWRAPLYFRLLLRTYRRFDYVSPYEIGVVRVTLRRWQDTGPSWPMRSTGILVEWGGGMVGKGRIGQLTFFRTAEPLKMARQCLRGTGYKYDWRDRLVQRLMGVEA
jgi:hypothetical protein